MCHVRLRRLNNVIRFSIYSVQCTDLYYFYYYYMYCSNFLYFAIPTILNSSETERTLNKLGMGLNSLTYVRTSGQDESMFQSQRSDEDSLYVYSLSLRSEHAAKTKVDIGDSRYNLLLYVR